MRIISGYLKNRQLKSAVNLKIRPATDKVKETIFNILQSRLDLRNKNVLDLFAGTGSLAIEAISRGATNVTFVDNSPKVCNLIKENLEMLKIEEMCKVICSDALKFIQKSDSKYDLIFADPPYEYPFINEIPKKIFSYDLLKQDGFLIIEHSKKTIFEQTDIFKIKIQKKFGNTVVTFFIHNIKEWKWKEQFIQVRSILSHTDILI